MKCDCDTTHDWIPESAHPKGSTQTPRNRLVCACCGARWSEDDSNIVNAVHRQEAAQRRAEEERAKRVAAKPKCQRWRGRHEYILLRGGDRVCRHCGINEKDGEPTATPKLPPQVELDEESKRVLYENRWDLYE